MPYKQFIRPISLWGVLDHDLVWRVALPMDGTSQFILLPWRAMMAPAQIHIVAVIYVPILKPLKDMECELLLVHVDRNKSLIVLFGVG